GDSGQVLAGGDLLQHDRANEGGEHRQERQHQGEGRPGQPGHGQLVGDVGITEEHTPTPAPASSSTGWENAGRAWLSPAGVTATAATSMAAPSRSMPPIGPAWPGVPWPALAVRCPGAT